VQFGRLEKLRENVWTSRKHHPEQFFIKFIHPHHCAFVAVLTRTLTSGFSYGPDYSTVAWRVEHQILERAQAWRIHHQE
jgi:hypothetical protein